MAVNSKDKRERVMGSDGKKSGLKRKLAIAAVLGVVAVGSGFAWMHIASARRVAAKVSVEVADLKVPEGESAAIERGRYLVDHLMGCKVCHGSDLGGHMVMDNGAMGAWYGPNITRGRGSNTADYAGRDWVRALRHGVSKDGRRLLLMPSDDYVNFGDQDLGSVVAYLRSVPAVDRENQPIRLGPVAKALIATGKLQFAFDKIDHQAKRPDAAPGAGKEWGAVLVGSCTGCHGKGLSGGKIPGGDPSWPAARNISPDKDSGIGTWSYKDFSRAMREGKRPDGSDLRDPMPWKGYAGLKEDDMKALWEYVGSTPGRAYGNR